MNLVKIADMLKSASDQNLMQEIQNPTGSVPSYMVLSELERRKKLRSSHMMPTENTSVAEDAEAEAQAQRADQMGIGSLGPVGQAVAQPQAYAGGGEVKHYATGDYVDYGGGYETDPSQNTFWPSWEEIKKRTGYGRMLPQTPVAEPAAPVAPVVAAPGIAGVPAAQRAASGVAPVASRPASRPAAPVAATPEKLEDWGQQIKDIVGKQADAYQKQADIYAKQAEELDKTKSTDISLALMQAGFGIMGGRSQFAAENIGQGAMPAVQQYAAMDRARRDQAQKLALGQGALGIEQLGAQLKGVSAGAEYGLGKEKLDIARKSAEADAMYKRALAGAAGAGKADANAMRMMALREKAIEALEKRMDFQTMTPAQQEAEIQRRMQILSGPSGATAAPTIAGTYNPKTGRIE